jgi:2-polyprenyl-3-methyl-5-hydroxy-6-metoxy-1,4-benzoquinol methylase
MNGAFYQAKFASQQYGGDAYDVKSLLPFLNLQPGFCYLEVGVGTGCFLHDFMTNVGVKPRRICAADLENNLQGTATELGVPIEFERIKLGEKALPYGSHAFEIVVCNHVLEHIFETEAALRELLRVTSKDGLCVVSVPNLANWWSRFTLLFFGELPLGLDTGTESGTDGLTPYLRRRFGGGKPSGHIRGFTPRALRDICERCGFQFVGWWNQNIGLRNKLIQPKMGIVLRNK